MTEIRKLAAVLAADVVGFSRLAGADEDRTLARLRALRSDLIDPTMAVHHGRVVKRTGDGILVEFRSVVDAVRCAIEVQNGMEAEGHIVEALRLSPRDIMAYHWMFLAGVAKLQLGSDEEAAAWERRSIDANRNFPLAHFYLAVALAHLGRSAEARAAVQTGMALDPTFTVSRWRSIKMSDNPAFLAQRERIHDGLRKAGAPEE
jgi:tetratricopeptide (TPR) repeat protein